MRTRLAALALIGILHIAEAHALPIEPIIYPLSVAKISSSFGQRNHPIRRTKHLHSGIDISAPIGTTVRSIQGGRVVYAAPFGGYGKLITIDHGAGICSLYGHLANIQVAVGEPVVAGEIIGTVGITGNTTGPHLHFEIRIGGVPVDPQGVWD